MKLKNDNGSIDFVQIIIGLLIIVIAVIGTFQALFWGYEKLDEQMRHRKALSMARSHVEYIQARVHIEVSEMEPEFMSGTLNRPEKKLLDKRNPNVDYDDIYCNVKHSAIRNVDSYYIFEVSVEWEEPGRGRRSRLHEVTLLATMVPTL